MSEKEKKDLISYLIKEVQIYSNDEQAVMPLKSITLNFPIYIDNKEVNKLLWDKQGSVETLVVLSHKKPDLHIEVKIDFDNASLDKSVIAERVKTVRIL